MVFSFETTGRIVGFGIDIDSMKRQENHYVDVQISLRATKHTIHAEESPLREGMVQRFYVAKETYDQILQSYRDSKAEGPVLDGSAVVEVKPRAICIN